MRRRLALPLAAAACLAAFASASLADAQQIAATVCIACHGEGGNSVVPMFPRLAGLQSEYVAKQLNDYLASKRKSDVMAPVIAGLKADDVPGLAAYYAAQKPAPGKVQDDKLAAAGKALFEDGNTASGVPACVGCHQAGALGNERYPRLAGQHQAYTLLQMQQFKSGARTNDRARVMRAVAERMTEQEMAAVSEYLAGL
jgi:cytochrome c553